MSNMSDVKQKIKESKIIPIIKKLLINDCDQQLEGTFGFQKNGKLEDISNLPNIKNDSAEYSTRKKIENYIFNKTESGLSIKQAREELIREYSFTYINRFIAFKMLEERKIVEETISKEYKSKGFIFYMADNPKEEKNYKKGKEYEAYKNFFLYQCKILSNEEEIKLLFDPDSLVSQLFPKEITLNKIFKLLNTENLSSIWKEDEVIGWVYQYFIEDDKKRVFDKIYKDKKKMGLEDIASATQIFTPKWIVRYLVQNTLGRLWIRMHPDSNIGEKLNYYVPNEGDKELIEFKCVKDITLLDPACGTMHFGMVAFDLFYDMYVEELERQGCKGWPKIASVKSIDEIPQAIIENNIYGIEIDYRSIQLSALSLYLKAKSKSKNSSIQKYNLVCTNISKFTEDDIDNFINSISSKYEITKKLLRLIIPELNKAYYLGSLLKIEDTINDFILKEKISLEERFKEQLDLFVTEEQRQLALEEGVSWEDVKEELLKAMEEFINKANGGRESYLALESKKGVSLIDSLIKLYDVVVTNPPFLGNRNIMGEMLDELKMLYKINYSDLYSIFIQRCIKFLKKSGLLGMITQQSFMFISSFEDLRKHILDNVNIVSLQQFGSNAFPGLGGDKISTCAFILYKGKAINQSLAGVYFRLVDEKYEEKKTAFENSLVKYKNNEEVEKVFVLPQEKLKKFPQWSFIYWINDSVRDLFFNNKQLIYYADPKKGISTGDVFRFLRFWWEIGKTSIMFNTNAHLDAKNSKFKWFPYMKGGDSRRWYGNQEYVINWNKDGKELKEFTPKSVIRNEEYYFNESTTYTYITLDNFSLRYMPKGFIFDASGPIIHPKKINLYVLLGLMNSKFISFITKLISPTISYEVGDIGKVPICNINKSEELINRIEKSSRKCVFLKTEIEKSSELSWDFEILTDWENGNFDILEKEKELIILESEMSKEVYNLYCVSHEDIQQIEDEFGRLPADFELIQDLNSEKLKNIDNLFLKRHNPKLIINNVDSSNGNNDINDKKRKKGNIRYLTLEEVCLASKLHPETVYRYIERNKLERKEERFELAIKYISYAIGLAMGRYKVGGIVPDDDGITVIDQGHPDDLPRKIELILNKIVGEKNTSKLIEIIGGDLRKFLNYEFFTKHHLKLYRKRPVYWLLQTSKKNYGFYIYNVKFTNDTLYSLIQKYINPRIKLEDSRLGDLRQKDNELSLGKEKREIGKLIEKSIEFLEELGGFKEKINEVIDSGYRPHIDDGVILNMAPLYKLVSWKEPEKYYEQLKEGKYKWSNISKIVKNSDY